MAPHEDVFSTNSVMEDVMATEFDEEETVLSEELARIAKEDLNEDKETREISLAQFRTWIRANPRLHNIRTDRKFLLRFLRSQKFDLTKSCRVLENYVRMRAENPEWFTNLDPSHPKSIELMDEGFLAVLPERDLAGRRVIVNMATRFDMETHANADIMKLAMATLETLMEDEENQIRGITCVLYCKGMTLAHCGIWTPSEAARLFGTCEKNLAARYKDIALMHLPFLMSAVVEFLKQFLSPKIKSRINNLNCDSRLAKKFAGGSTNLPPELGGNGPTMRELAKRLRDQMDQNRDTLLAMDQMDYVGEDLEVKTVDHSNRDNRTLDKVCQPSSRGFWSFIPGM